MMQTSTTEEPKFTYEEAVEKLTRMGIHSHEVRVYSTRWGSQVLGCFSEDDARELALQLVEVARDLHGEEWVKDGYGPDTLDEELGYDELMERDHWTISVWNKLPRAKHDEEKIDVCPEFVFGHRMGAYRAANPKSKVFLSTGGRDCDGYRWGSVHEFSTLLEAHEYLEEAYKWADGPMGWSVITQDQFETYGG